MTPTEHCFAELRRLCLKHDPSLAIALDLVLEDMASEASAPSATGPEPGQISTLDAPDPQGESTHEGLSVRARALRGNLEDSGSDGEWAALDAELEAALQAKAAEPAEEYDPFAEPPSIQQPNDLPEESEPFYATPEEAVEDLEAHSGMNPYMMGVPPVPELDALEEFVQEGRPSPVEPPPAPVETSDITRECLRGHCVQLRRQGFTLTQIAEMSGAPRGSVSYLFKGADTTRPAETKDEAIKIVQVLDARVRHADLTMDEIRGVCLGVPADLVQLALREYRADLALLTYLWHKRPAGEYQAAKAELLTRLKGREAMSESLFPLGALVCIDNDRANELLVRWKHSLGPCERPFRTESFALEINDQPVAVAMSCSIVHGPVAEYQTQQVVELARLCSDNAWCNRVMLRLWREVCAPRYKCWAPEAVVSYSHNGLHKGSLYRADGWEKVREDCGTTGKAGNWGRRGKGYENTALHGLKTLWVYRYPKPPPLRLKGEK